MVKSVSEGHEVSGQDFSGSLVLKTAFQCMGCRFDPWSGS